MRNPADDGTDQRTSRRRDRAAAASGTAAPGDSGRHRSPGGSARSGARQAGPATGAGPDGAVGGTRPAGAGPAGGPGAGSSVFAPGYDASRPGSGPPRGGEAGRSPWYGSAADGAAGKGPVRGYPPAPGQPSPMYPPGQFAAWNRGRDGRARTAPGPDGRTADDSGQPPADRPRTSADQGGRGPQQSSWQSAPAGSAAGSRYYGRDDGYGRDEDGDAEPGYSMLAVSDPAADVTSTQTWQAVGDGRATGVWTAPAKPGAGPGRRAAGPPAPPDTANGAGASAPGAPGATLPSGTRLPGPRAVPPADRAGAAGGPGTGGTGTSGTATAELAAGLAGTSAPGTGAPGMGAPGTGAPGDTRPRGRSRSGAHTTPSVVVRGRGPDGATGPRATRSRSQRTAASAADVPQARPGKTRGSRAPSVRLAIAVALILVVAAAGTLAYSVLHSGAKPKPSAASSPTTPASASASPSPTLGPYGLIGTRSADPKPLTTAQLFPVSFTLASKAVTLTASKLSRSCSSALTGSAIESAAQSAGCDQAARATYLSVSQGLMGTIGVLNLSTAKGATKVARSASASDYISQLKAAHGLTRKIGGGTGIEEAAAKGHYLILIWAEFTSLRRPKTAAERTEVENFMTELLQNTANVSLTTRMLTGTP